MDLWNVCDQITNIWSWALSIARSRRKKSLEKNCPLNEEWELSIKRCHCCAGVQNSHFQSHESGLERMKNMAFHFLVRFSWTGSSFFFLKISKTMKKSNFLWIFGNARTQIPKANGFGILWNFYNFSKPSVAV